ncbi:MAG: pyrroloquinoline quinone biosynthesis protein PqqB [Candidatus Rokuibacteriota bacterium]
MFIRVLGSAAGGGFPQWNCGCPNCRGLREGTVRAQARTQECVAVSADGAAWLLLNCSPEIRQQIEGFPGLHPRGPRDSPIAAILVTNGDLDHCLGLLSLRESHPLMVYATEPVRRGFVEDNVLYRTLERFPGQVTWRTLKLGGDEEIVGPDGRPTGLAVTPLAVPGKPPIHLEHRAPPAPEDNIGVRVREQATGRVLAYCSAAAAVTDDMRRVLDGADAVFFDGTFWSSDELPALGLGTKRAEEMAHLPVGGPGGSLARLAGLRARRRVYIHINNTNPMLRDDSAERAQVDAAGWEIAGDGMEVRL